MRIFKTSISFQVPGEIPEQRQIEVSLNGIPRLEVKLTCLQRYRKSKVTESDGYNFHYKVVSSLLHLNILVNPHFAKRKQ